MSAAPTIAAIVLLGGPLLAGFLRWDLGHLPLVATALALLAFGIALPDQLKTLLDQATSILLAR